MDHLREMKTLVCVAKTQSFNMAARQLGVSRPTVTRLISNLERRLGVLLLVRSTHHVAITPAGQSFAEEAADILLRVERLHQEIEGDQAELSGMIRLGAPPSFAAMYLAQAIQKFRQAAPGVTFEVVADIGELSVVKEALDFSIRIAPILPDTALTAQLLVRVPQLLAASPAYVEASGSPSRPEDLAAHDCLVHTIKSPTAIWTFNDGVSVSVHASIRSNLGEVLRQAALQGQGISIHPTYMIRDDLDAGRLVRLMPEYSPAEMSIYAIYAARRFRPPRVLAFVEFLRKWLREDRQLHMR